MEHLEKTMRELWVHKATHLQEKEAVEAYVKRVAS